MTSEEMTIWMTSLEVIDRSGLDLETTEVTRPHAKKI